MSGMITGNVISTASPTKGGTMCGGGTPNFDERTGQPAGTTKGGPTKQAPIRQEEPAPEPEAEMTFTFVEGKETWWRGTKLSLWAGR